MAKTYFAPRSNNSYSHVALYACPGGPDNHPGAYFWRLTNGKVTKTFHVEDKKRWLLELIPIQPQGGKMKADRTLCQMACSVEDGAISDYDKELEPPARIQS